MDFPIMPHPQDKTIFNMLSDPLKIKFGENYNPIIYLEETKWSYQALELLKILRTELTSPTLNTNTSELLPKIELKFIDFIINYDNIVSFINETQDFNAQTKQEILSEIENFHKLCRQILNFKVKTIDGLLSLEEADNLNKSNCKNKIFEQLAKNSQGMNELQIRKMLDIVDEDDFIKLGIERTKTIFPNTKSNQEIIDILSQISPIDAIIIASYFAKTRIQQYGDLKYELSNINEPSKEKKIIIGDCKHFSGLAIHYINKIIKPLNPNLKNWYFGIETSNIGNSYHHGFLKAIHLYHEKEEDKINVFMFDPTKLANEIPANLTENKIKKVIDALTDNNHYLQIKRYAEDFLN
ncbi:hypothetical protein KKC59_03525 [bacterium]|nr:hypothetical protein [bacterium]